jgi:hypothetical protein
MNSYEYLAVAKRRWPQNCVGGSGRFALYTPAAGVFGKILLFETREEAQRLIADHGRVQIIDLLEPPVPICRTVPEPYDHEEARRERRERKNA